MERSFASTIGELLALRETEPSSRRARGTLRRPQRCVIAADGIDDTLGPDWKCKAPEDFNFGSKCWFLDREEFGKTLEKGKAVTSLDLLGELAEATWPHAHSPLHAYGARGPGQPGGLPAGFSRSHDARPRSQARAPCHPRAQVPNAARDSGPALSTRLPRAPGRTSRAAVL